MHDSLTDEEAAARRARGEGNDWKPPTSRTYAGIVRANLFSFFNNLLFGIGAALIVLGRTYDALTSVGLGLINALISTAQEVRAKWQLDRIALLNHPTVRLVRAGAERDADPAEIVKGDILRLKAGDQVMVDGPLISDAVIEVDESLLTGESEPVRKKTGDALLSGSTCVAGGGIYRAEKVGRDSYAAGVASRAREFRLTRTPLQRQIDFAVRVIMVVVALMSAIILLAAVLEKVSTVRFVQLAAMLSGQVPYGLFFVVVVAYAVGAAAIGRRGALIQQINAVESLSNVDVLCSDKTGTLTTNRLALKNLIPADGIDRDDLARLIGRFGASSTDAGATVVALRDGAPAAAATPAHTVPFSSARAWSALAFDAGDAPGAYVLGAFDKLAPALDPGPARDHLAAALPDLAAEGHRVLMFARNRDAATLAGDTPHLPPLEPLGLAVFSDELRPNVADTLATFRKLGVDLKIISGDDPRTVVALARQAGVDGEVIAMTGEEIESLDDAALAAAAERATVFGRVAPAQKERLVAALKRSGHRVAMLGDGVNDALALKKADLGIAMESGSAATRNVADIVLIGDDFAPLPPAFDEGQRIVSGMSTIMALFLARVMASILMIVAITMLGLAFPFEPAQIATSLFTVGIPALLLSMWARPERQQDDFFGPLVRFVIPVAAVTMIIGTALYTFQYNRVVATVSAIDIPARVIAMFERATGVDYSSTEQFSVAAATIVAQTVLSVFIAYSAFISILFVEPPNRFFAAWRPESPDRRPAYLTVALGLVFAVIVQTGWIASYFALIPLGPGMMLQIAGALVVWTLLLREIWRRNWFDRILGLGD